ncbi:hypothetical protein SCHPADRAFT_948027 [Schizopora paradoxa]|uniref:Uncharacterized protein n=1 Tax=Schizopora paradoxa TaxID=27342 RepID=A0A0H2RGJ6_9AGAM|nr:hypothetical protein SCHPADRAFT_948027 [Schizopora paradoxa]
MASRFVDVEAGADGDSDDTDGLSDDELFGVDPDLLSDDEQITPTGSRHSDGHCNSDLSISDNFHAVAEETARLYRDRARMSRERQIPICYL